MIYEYSETTVERTWLTMCTILQWQKPLELSTSNCCTHGKSLYNARAVFQHAYHNGWFITGCHCLPVTYCTNYSSSFPSSLSYLCPAEKSWFWICKQLPPLCFNHQEMYITCSLCHAISSLPRHVHIPFPWTSNGLGGMISQNTTMQVHI
jgi:hypothetical protein